MALPGGADGTGLDPAAALLRLARRLEAAHEAEPGNANLARELRVTLQVLAGDDAMPPPPDEVDQIRAEWEAPGGV